MRSSDWQRLIGSAMLSLAIAAAAPAGLAEARQAAVAVPTPKPQAAEAAKTEPQASDPSAESATGPAAGETGKVDPAKSGPEADADSDADAAAQSTDAASPSDAAAAASETPSAPSMSSVVVDVATGKVLSEHDASERRYPASTTKLMTAYLALKALREGRVSLDSPVIVTRLAASQAPAKMGYPAGSVIRLDTALKMMLVKSANDIAMAIGQSLAHESEGDFVDMMNAEAAALGMKDTHYINPNGLPGEGQYSSAKDLATIAVRIRREFPAFAGYFDIEAITNGKALMRNGNKLLGRFEGADGMKTGYICASGFNLVSSATRNGRTLVAVVLGANGTIPRERLSASLLQAGFETDPATKDVTLDQLPTSSGEVLDISDFICGKAGRTARANERVEEENRDEMFGSPYLTEMKRAPVTVKVGLGGAAGNDLVDPGVSIIANYGIPIPTPRPTPPAPDTMAGQSDGTASGGTGPDGAAPGEAASPLPTADRPTDKPSAVNAYSGRQSALRFKLGVHSPLAKRGPRLDTEIGFDLRPAAYGHRGQAAEIGAN
ncbi:D-alanyl-D-alanine carboxypeptidase family protein [Jiella sonneratiae]|uniref:D-alanyl-D-alanine carboxypeptidase family protein n=1 Tax=Jiella sonneratiae TaxID=2816856 RepID=UPI00315ABDA7